MPFDSNWLLQRVGLDRALHSVLNIALRLKRGPAGRLSSGVLYRSVLPMCRLMNSWLKIMIQDGPAISNATIIRYY
jgi:hypothetical protein